MHNIISFSFNNTSLTPFIHPQCLDSDGKGFWFLGCLGSHKVNQIFFNFPKFDEVFSYFKRQKNAKKKTFELWDLENCQIIPCYLDHVFFGMYSFCYPVAQKGACIR